MRHGDDRRGAGFGSSRHGVYAPGPGESLHASFWKRPAQPKPLPEIDLRRDCTCAPIAPVFLGVYAPGPGALPFGVTNAEPCSRDALENGAEAGRLRIGKLYVPGPGTRVP